MMLPSTEAERRLTFYVVLAAVILNALAWAMAL